MSQRLAITAGSIATLREKIAAATKAAALAAGFWAGWAATADAQQAGIHYRFDAQPPTGSVGQTRLEHGGPVHGYFQPVQISGPKGTLVGLPEQGEWLQLVDGPVNAGMLIGKPYRIKVTGMELHPGRDCYPTIEIIDRTYAPAGLERRFPIQIVLNTDDLDLAMRGMLVTRVVYIEDPGQALPGAQVPGDQLWFDAGPGANPLLEADRLGRPVAILRIGGRVPSTGGPDWEFMYGCPAWQRLPTPPAEPLPATEPVVTPVPVKTTRTNRSAVGR
jgi:hypothetical protein